MFAAISYRDGALNLLDQRRLPHKEEWLKLLSLEEVAIAIEAMVVRGAPAIACAAAYALALDAQLALQAGLGSWQAYRPRFAQGCARLAATRPTAVNLFHALARMEALAATLPLAMLLEEVCSHIRAEADLIFANDVRTCQAIGEQGYKLLAASGKKLKILTHCNTGSLATAGYGTALGVIRSLHTAGLIERIYVDETRPWLQGARLTAYELQQEGIPFTLIVDSAAAHLMSKKEVDCVIVGADRIAANGDTANKIGTYSLAIVARHHDVPFYIAAPFSSIDLTLAEGEGMTIELRPASEITHLKGQAVAPLGCEAYNPSFDITPHKLIAGIITEGGILATPLPPNLGEQWNPA